MNWNTARGDGVQAVRGMASERDSTARKGKGRNPSGTGGKGKTKGKTVGEKPTDDPEFVRWSVGMRFVGEKTYVVDSFVASGTFSRVFLVHPETGKTRRWKEKSHDAQRYAAKVMRENDTYIQYTSNARKEGDILKRLEASQIAQGKEVLTMRCFDSLAVVDEVGEPYWCLVLEWLGASLFDLVRANGRGLHLSMVRILMEQLLLQLQMLQELHCTHTDIKHKNCCLADTEHFMIPTSSGRPTLILTNPSVKFIDYGNAVFEGEAKTHPIHTKQFRAPEVLLNVAQGWGPPSDTWTLGVTAAYLVSGQLLFNSHDPCCLVHAMAEALGPFPPALLGSAQDKKVCRAAREGGGTLPQLGSWLGLGEAREGTAEVRCVDLLLRMMALDPAARISAAEALRHPFITACEPAVPSPPPGTEFRVL